MLRVVESSDLRDSGWLDLEGLREVGVVQGVRTERHLLRPFDVLVTARSGAVQAALVPPEVSRTVAGVTLLVVRPKEPESGMGHWLWYFLTSAQGRAQIASRMTVTATLKSLSAGSLGEIEAPIPSPRDWTRRPGSSKLRRRHIIRPWRRRGCGGRRCATRSSTRSGAPTHQ